MCRKILCLICLIVTVPAMLVAQELKATVTINTRQLGTPADKKAFQTCQAALNNFMNNCRWTNEKFETNEKIVCNFLLNVEAQGSNIYKASSLYRLHAPFTIPTMKAR